jgi:hypothetical protein
LLLLLKLLLELLLWTRNRRSRVGGVTLRSPRGHSVHGGTHRPGILRLVLRAQGGAMRLLAGLRGVHPARPTDVPPKVPNERDRVRVHLIWSQGFCQFYE